MLGRYDVAHVLGADDVPGTAVTMERVASDVLRPVELCHHAQTWSTQSHNSHTTVTYHTVRAVTVRTFYMTINCHSAAINDLIVFLSLTVTFLFGS